MEYTTWHELQHNQTQTPTLPSYPPPSLSSSSSYPLPPPSSSYTTHYLPYPQNPNPSSSSSSSSFGGNVVVEPGVNPPGVDSYVPPLPLGTIHVVGTHEPLLPPPNFLYSNTQVGHDSSSSVVAFSGYYVDADAQNWAAREAVRQYGADPLSYAAVTVISTPSNGSEQLAVANPTANPNPTWWTNTTTQPHGNQKWKQPSKKSKTKNMQSAYCEVCKIDCTSKEVLDQHKLGKKHKKNVEKLRELLRLPQVHPPLPGSSNPVIGPQLLNDKSISASANKSKRKTVETPEDLEKKKKKVLEGGAAAEAVRICAICNVVCNSQTVYNYHLAGQKHAAMMKKASEHTQPNAS